MNFKKRMIALCLVTAAALSLVFAAPAKQSNAAGAEQGSLLCEFYEEVEYKRC